ncbi:1,4-dihydroxy-2-naphthoyl-CoA hydrolase [Chlamydiales bacterium STE3]|nr:1,4-dihydroxy-2-naphthoyl-CoA hydrolase [Chlamydiales bacterium STE3]
MAMEFIAKNKVRMHDTDMAGILYFARQFRFAHDALEDFFEQETGTNFDDVFKKQKSAFVIVHCEADYFTPLAVGDPLDIHLLVNRIGQTSFTLFYKIFRKGHLVGTVKTVHVAIKTDTRTKTEIPAMIRNALEKYRQEEN